MIISTALAENLWYASVSSSHDLESESDSVSQDQQSERERAHVWRGSGTPMSIALTILTEGVRESVRVCIARTGSVARREKRRHGGHWRQAVSLGRSHGV